MAPARGSNSWNIVDEAILLSEPLFNFQDCTQFRVSSLSAWTMLKRIDDAEAAGITLSGEECLVSRLGSAAETETKDEPKSRRLF